METYPQYFRKEGRCIRRDSPTTGIIVELPEPGKKLPLILAPTTYPTRERFDEVLIEFEVSDAGTYKDFVSTFCKSAAYMGSRLSEKLELERVQAQNIAR